MRKLNITKEWLQQKYIHEQLSSTQIAKLLNCNYMTILNKLKFFNIPSRKDGALHPQLTKEFLLTEYFEKNKSLTKIANETNTSPSAIRRRFIKYGLEARARDIFKECKGEQFGQWKVLRRINDKLECICSCGRKRNVKGTNLRSGISTCCQECSKMKHHGSKHKSWSGYEEISGSVWTKIIQSAKKRKLELNITIKEVWELFLTQNRRCKLSNEVLYFPKNGIDCLQGKYNASLDRIDSSKGYISGNIQWVHKDINKIKSNLKDEEFIKLCKLVAQAQS